MQLRFCLVAFYVEATCETPFFVENLLESKGSYLVAFARSRITCSTDGCIIDDLVVIDTINYVLNPTTLVPKWD